MDSSLHSDGFSILDYVYMYVCMYVCMTVCMCVCVCVCVSVCEFQIVAKQQLNFDEKYMKKKKTTEKNGPRNNMEK